MLEYLEESTVPYMLCKVDTVFHKKLPPELFAAEF